MSSYLEGPEEAAPAARARLVTDHTERLHIHHYKSGGKGQATMVGTMCLQASQHTMRDVVGRRGVKKVNCNRCGKNERAADLLLCEEERLQLCLHVASRRLFDHKATNMCMLRWAIHIIAFELQQQKGKCI